MSILQTTELKKYYGTKPNITKALDGVNLSVEQALIISTTCELFRTLHNFFARLCAESWNRLKPWNAANRFGAC